MKVGIRLRDFLPEAVQARAEKWAAVGYDAVDFQGFVHTETELFEMDGRAFERTLRRDGEAIRAAGLFISQSHGPWRWPGIRDATPEDRAERFEKMSRSLYGAAVLGAPYLVLHPMMPFGKEDDDPKTVWEVNIDHYGRLAEVGKRYGVMLCLENMPFPRQSQASVAHTLQLIGDIGSDNIGFCLDTGHCLRTGDSPAEAVKRAGKERLRVLHVHDNDGTRDNHRYPGEGINDWKAFAAALAELPFEGTVSLETNVYPDTPEDRIDQTERMLFARARAIAENRVDF